MRALGFAKYLALILGLVLMVIAYMLFQSASAFLDKAVSAEGTVTELVRSRSDDSISYRPVVEFTAQNGTPVEFVSSVGSNPPNYSPGERVEVLYDPANPVDAQLNSNLASWGGSVVVAGIGGLFLVSGLVMFFTGRRNAARKAALMQEGLRLETTYQGVERNTGFSVNGKHPYNVNTQWLNPESLEVHVFKSENLWFDPSPYIDTQTIAVFIEQGNPGKYHMDLSFLPKLAG